MTKRQAEKAVIDRATTFCNYLGGCKMVWIDGKVGPHWEVRTHRLRPLLNACASLAKLRGGNDQRENEAAAMKKKRGPSFCWRCGRRLMLPYYAVWKDPIGHRHRVHKICRETLESEPKPTTPAEIVGWRIRYHGIDDGDEAP